MTNPLRAMAAACLLFLTGCATDGGPCRNQDLTVSAPTTTSLLYPGCHGRTVRVIARMEPHGSRVEALRVLVTGRDGAVHAEAPSVRVGGGTAVQAITSDSGAAVIWFGCPGPCDGSVVSMSVTVPQTSPCPYRLRLVPVLRAP
jgi:hypothetical protein